MGVMVTSQSATGCVWAVFLQSMESQVYWPRGTFYLQVADMHTNFTVRGCVLGGTRRGVVGRGKERMCELSVHVGPESHGVVLRRGGYRFSLTLRKLGSTALYCMRSHWTFVRDRFPSSFLCVDSRDYVADKDERESQQLVYKRLE